MASQYSKINIQFLHKQALIVQHTHLVKTQIKKMIHQQVKVKNRKDNVYNKLSKAMTAIKNDR
jgi:hypothetical protein